MADEDSTQHGDREPRDGRPQPEIRMELVGSVRNIFVYDDFAHHPTAIKSTLDGLRAKVGSEKIFAGQEYGVEGLGPSEAWMPTKRYHRHGGRKCRFGMEH